MADQNKIQRVRDTIGTHPDFPKKGIMFKDIFPILRNPDVFQDLMDVMIDHVKQLNCDVIVGLEARGFLFGPVMSLALKKPFVPIRKKGKLPGDCIQVEYRLEYGSDIFEAQVGSITAGQKVVIIDDLLATGGTLDAACQLVEKMGGSTVECLVVISLRELNGIAKVPAKVTSLLELSEY